MREHACLLLEALGFSRDEVFEAEIHMAPSEVSAVVYQWKRDEDGKAYRQDGAVASDRIEVTVRI